jgi:hypothetical protein
MRHNQNLNLEVLPLIRSQSSISNMLLPLLLISRPHHLRIRPPLLKQHIETENITYTNIYHLGTLRCTNAY